MKLRWGSEQDLEDALAICVRQAGRLALRAMRAFERRIGAARGLRDLERRAEELSRR